MSAKTTIARNLRKLGLSSIVDSPSVRRLARAASYHKPNDIKETSSTQRSTNLGPQLTVVVPAYNVEKYLAQCLDSILSQSYTNLDVVVVNDGSTDSTPSICDKYAETHKRVRVFHKVNSGLGAARNTGLELSTAEFITFVDSDDIVPPGAYERAMNSLSHSGSDVCIGAVSRFDSKNRWVPFWVNLAHDEDRTGIHGSTFPPIMWDVFAWNKVYRRSTWNRLVGRFPEGTLYEDQECTAKLFVGEAKLDILKEVGYNWRLRDDNTSITQQKTSLDDLSQRLDVAFNVLRIIDSTNIEYLTYWYAKTLGEDLFYYIREIPRASDDFYDLLSKATRSLWEQAPEPSIYSIDPVRRLLAYTTAHCSRGELENLLVHLERTKNAFHGYMDEGNLSFRVEDSTHGDFYIPQRFRTVSPDTLKPKIEITSYQSNAEGDVTCHGYGFLPNYDLAFGYSADLFNDITDSVVATLEINAETGPVPVQLSDAYHDYRDRRFTLRISRHIIDDLAEQSGSTQSDNLQLRIHLHAGEHTWTVDEIKRDLHSSAGYPGASDITERGARLAFYGDPRQKTEVIILRPRLTAELIKLDCNRLTVSLKPTSKSHDSLAHDMPVDSESQLFLTASNANSELARARFIHEDGGHVATLVVPTNDFSAAKSIDNLKLHVVDRTGKRWAIAINRKHGTRDRNRDVTIGMSGFGYALLERPVQAATAESVEISKDGTTLNIKGTFALDRSVARTTTPTFALVASQRVIQPIATTVDHANRTFDAKFSLISEATSGQHSVLDNDRYIFQLLLTSGKSHPASAWVATSYDMELRLPEQYLSPLHSVSINAVGTSRSLRIDLADHLEDRTEAGKFNEAKNAAVFLNATRPITGSTVLFESFSGTAVADSPLALDREIAQKYPDTVRLWTVKNPLTPVPPGAKPVVAGSQAWYQAVSSSKVLINNNNFPYYFNKHPDQFYVQTWHGTPLKQIGNHVPPRNLSLSYRSLMKKEAENYWDILIAQSSWAASILSDAFDFKGRVLDFGYPRNDVLADKDRLDSLRRNTRRRLGLNPDQRVVLYAPTWRDNLRERSGHYSSVDFLNVNKASHSLGSGSTVLYRGHSNSLNSSPKPINKLAIDVSRYPDINELIAASDVLVTDYSSIMFDYVVTGKPMVFLCPDLEEYRDSVRGFYFDFEAVAPGPIFKSAKSAIEFLQSDILFSTDSTERYLDFSNTYAGFDDGHASERVVREISDILAD